MAPVLPNNQQRNPRHRVVAVMTRAQEDAMRRLRQAGVPETSALMVMQRISSFGVQTLRELDALYRQFNDIVAEDGRNAAHQEWVDNKAAALLLQLESAIATLVAEAIRQATDELKTQPPPAGQVIEPAVASQLPPPPAGQSSSVGSCAVNGSSSHGKRAESCVPSGRRPAGNRSASG